MTIYALTTIRNNKYDEKNSKNFSSKDELTREFDRLKKKYNANENPTKETTMGSMGSHGLFKFAEGVCKHGKKIKLEYSEVQGIFTCFS